MRTDIGKRKEEILQWVNEGRSFMWMSRELNCRTGTVKTWLKKLGIEYSGNQGNKGYSDPSYKPASYYFDNKQPIGSAKLKEKLFRDGLKEEKCEGCGLDEWMGQKMPLELDHINGNHHDNSFENLKVLCANCHALTETYCRGLKAV